MPLAVRTALATHEAGDLDDDKKENLMKTTSSAKAARVRLAIGLTAVALIVTPATSAATTTASFGAFEAQSETTTIAVQSAAVNGGSIAVAGVVNYGADALGPVTLSEDVAGDVAVAGVGLDVGDVSVETDLAKQQLIFTLQLHDGLAAPVNGPGPFTGYMVPLLSDGDDRWRWLGAGGIGTNFPPQAGGWGALCSNESENGEQGGWSCTDAITTTISADSVRWELPFAKMKPQIQYGSMIESSSINCGSACSFQWPSFFNLAALFATDVSFPMDEYKVPGEVELGIAPTGTQPSAVSFGTKATFTPSTSAFNAVLPAPTTPGDYTVWTRTCYGAPISCVYGNAPIQIA